jgi:hypothetical protein
LEPGGPVIGALLPPPGQEATSTTPR